MRVFVIGSIAAVLLGIAKLLGAQVSWWIVTLPVWGFWVVSLAVLVAFLLFAFCSAFADGYTHGYKQERNRRRG